VVDLPGSSAVFEVAAADHAVARVDVEGLQGGEVRPRLVELEPEASLAGQVTTAAGAPVAGATARVSYLGNAAASDVTDALLAGELDKVDPLSGYGPRTRPEVRTATSDAQGRFELRGLGEGAYRVAVTVAGHDDLLAPRDIDLVRGPNEIAPIVLPNRATLQCAVLDASGRPLAGASVTVIAGHEGDEVVNFLEDLAEPIATGVTDAEGNVTVHWLLPGHVVIRARIDPDAEPESDGRSAVDLQAGRTAQVTVRMPGG
jgi:hypothetical protein